DLVGKRIQFTFDARDISHIRAYTMDGKLIGALKASGAWGREKHSLQLRQVLTKAFRERVLKFKTGQSLLEACQELRIRNGNSRAANITHYELTQSIRPQDISKPEGASPDKIKPLVKEVVAMPLTKVFVS